VPLEHPPPYSAFQAEIFLRGLAGERPQQPIALAALEELVESTVEPRCADYVFGGAGTGDTMRENLEAFRRWRIVPRILRDVSAIDLRVRVLGTDMPAPMVLAPIGCQVIAHPDAEPAVARAAASLGLTMTLSTVSSVPLEAVAAAADGPKWFQLYWPRSRELAASLLARAEQAGYQAIVVTLDTYLPGWRPRELQGAWQPYLAGIGIANYLADPVFRGLLERPPDEDPQAAVGQFVFQFSNPALTWHDVEWLRASTELPIALKGILHPGDARLAREYGVEAVVVSNHGGRQVDGAIASLQALPAIVETVGGELEVLLDSGVRSGADIVKALALGADAVLLGRPYLWGLAAGGEPGVRAVLRALMAEFELTLGLSGHARPGTVDRTALALAGTA
jgi:isopentenyl diphosphate isomerase/L-lactate dehydrogenase-like FMN-dependent dehydrogenase